MSSFRKWVAKRFFGPSTPAPRRSRRPSGRHSRFGVEQLESRQMLAITTTFAAGALTFTGDGADDTLVLFMEGGHNVSYIADGGPQTAVAGVNTVSFNGGGGTNVISILDDVGGSSFLVNGNTVTYNNTAPIPISLSNVQELHVNDNANAGGDTINVQRTTIPTIVGNLHGAGGDTYNISSNAPLNTGTLNNINAALTVSSGAGANHLFVSDAGGAITKSVTLTSSQIVGFAPVAVNYIQSASGSLVIDLRGANTQPTIFTVVSTLPLGNDVFLRGGPVGGSQFNIGSDAFSNNGNLDNVQALVHVIGLGANNGLEVDDFGAIGPFSYIVTPTTVTNDPTGPARTFGGVVYSGVATLELDATEGGSDLGSNIVTATPSATTTYFINADSLINTTMSDNDNDTLVTNLLGTTGAHVTKTALPPTFRSFNGSWTFTNRKPIFFTNFETISIAPVTIPILVVGTDAGVNSRPLVKVYDATTGALISSFLAYEANYTGGVRVAVGQFSGNGGFEIAVAPGRQHSPTVKIFDPFGDELGEFQAYGATFNAGMSIAAGNVEGATNPVNNAELDDIVVAPSRGISTIRVFQNEFLVTPNTPMALFREFRAWSPSFIGGSTVAVADLNADGRGDIVVGSGPGMQALIDVFDVTLPLSPFQTTYTPFRVMYPYALPYIGGVNVSAINVGIGVPNPLVIASQGNSGTSIVRVFNGSNGALALTFIAYTDKSRNAPVRTAPKVTSDGIFVIFVAQGSDGRNPGVKLFDPISGQLFQTLLQTDPTDPPFGGFFLA